MLSLVLLPMIAYSCRIDGYLMAVEKGTGKGSLVRLTVETAPGSGRVFVNTDPVVGTDVQVSIRIAKEVAESFTGVSGLDYYYTFQSGSPSIVGMSGGAGILGYTMAAQICKEPADVIATGIIYPDGSIGPVSGIGEKVLSAPDGFTVLIPYLNHNKTPGTIPVRDVSDIAYYFLGMKPKENHGTYADYEMLMREVASHMISEAEERGENATEARRAFDNGRYYTASSIAFQLWVDAREREFSGLSSGILRKMARTIIEAEPETPEIRTQRDAEIYIIYRERLEDARNSASNWTDYKDVAYAVERMRTAKVWLSMIGRLDGHRFDQDIEELARRNIEMAKEYYYYLYNLLPEEFLNVSGKYLERAEEAYIRGDYWLSLSYSLKSSANSMYVLEIATSGNLTQYLSIKREIVRRRTGRSFISWNYAQLAEYYSQSDPALSLLYYDYALAFSTLFPQKKGNGGFPAFLWLAFFAILLKMFHDKVIQCTKSQKRQRNTSRKDSQRKGLSRLSRAAWTLLSC